MITQSHNHYLYSIYILLQLQPELIFVTDITVYIRGEKIIAIYADFVAKSVIHAVFSQDFWHNLCTFVWVKI